MVNCERCRRDISSEPFRYEAGDGRTLCEKCFYGEEAAVEPHGAGFGFLRGMVYVLKAAGIIGLIGGLGLAHSVYVYNPLVSASAIMSGIVVFIICIVAGELIRLGLSIQDGIARIVVMTDRLPDLLRERHAGPVAPEVAQEDQERWGGTKGG